MGRHTMTSQAQSFPPNSIAPWAELVPGMGPVTVDDLLAIPDDGYIYEVVEGVLVRMTDRGEEATLSGSCGRRPDTSTCGALRARRGR